MTLINRSFSTTELLKGVQVLVIDNDCDSRDLYKALLEGCGANVVICCSIEDSLTVFDWLLPHVLLCELRFLGESIETLITKLSDMEQKGGHQIPAIAITSWINDSLAQLITTGFGGYLLKPIDLDALVSTIRRLVRAKRAKVFSHRLSLEAKLGIKRLAIARASRELAAFYQSHEVNNEQKTKFSN